VYTTVLTNVTHKWTVRLVPKAAIAAGLPVAGVQKLMTLVGTPKLAETYDKAIVTAVGMAVESAQGYGIR
jgi:ABC-type sulfate transport system substrate-binding protein